MGTEPWVEDQQFTGLWVNNRKAREILACSDHMRRTTRLSGKYTVPVWRGVSVLAFALDRDTRAWASANHPGRFRSLVPITDSSHSCLSPWPETSERSLRRVPQLIMGGELQQGRRPLSKWPLAFNGASAGLGRGKISESTLLTLRAKQQWALQYFSGVWCGFFYVMLRLPTSRTCACKV